MDRWTLIKAVPFIIGITAGVLLGRRSRSAGSRWRDAVGGGLLMFSGIVLVCLMAIHTVSIPLFRYLEPARVPPSPGRSVTVMGIRYDYRLYSLVLMGVVMLQYGIRSVRSAPGVARGNAVSRKRAWTATGMLGALSAPLIPLSFEAWLYAAVLLIGAAALAISQRSPAALSAPQSEVQERRTVLLTSR